MPPLVPAPAAMVVIKVSGSLGELELHSDRRKFLRSLSRSALVLPFTDILALAAPPQQPQAPPKQKIGPIERSYDAKPAPPPPGPKSPIEGTPLGVSFVDVVKGSGLDVVTTYGAVGKNKYLLETTGCGLPGPT